MICSRNRKEEARERVRGDRKERRWQREREASQLNSGAPPSLQGELAHSGREFTTEAVRVCSQMTFVELCAWS